MNELLNLLNMQKMLIGYTYQPFPKKVKVTSQFAEYLKQLPSEHRPMGLIYWPGDLPVEVDDAIDNDYYEFVF